jgi:hypothetical protein
MPQASRVCPHPVSRPGRRRGARVLAGLMAVTAAAATAGPAGATAAGHSARPQTICAVRPKKPNPDQASPGLYVSGTRYRVIDDRFGTLDPKQCLRLTPGGRPAWRVSTSQAHNRGNPVQAFPYIQYGCYWGWCTPGSALPLKISNIRSARSRWYTREHASGIWNAGYDLWLNSSRLARGHANRAEVMIWLDATTPHYRVGGPAGTRKVKIAGRWFYLTHWRTGTQTIRGGWEYVQYRLAKSSWHVRNLNVKAVLDDAARRHLISPAWYLQGILAGNEIWYGGTGLATTWFSAAVTAKKKVKAPKLQPTAVPGGGAPPVPLSEPIAP